MDDVEIAAEFEALERMAAKMAAGGIEFVIQVSGQGNYSIKADEVALYLSEPRRFEAALLDVPEEQHQAWLDYLESYAQCTGRTKAGKQCRNSGDDPYCGPAKFQAGVTDRCSLHKALEARG